MTAEHFDAVIVGAGPAGSSAAILLARAGWSVALVEKHAFPRRKVCGECIAASNLPLLRSLGIADAFDALAGPELRRVALLRGAQELVSQLPAAAHERYAWGRALGRESLDTLLRDEARRAGACVLQPWSVSALAGGAGDWRCEIRSGESGRARQLHAPLAIAANGSWEPLRAEGRPRRAHRAPDLFGFKANFLDAALAAGTLPVLSLDGGYGGMVVADDGIATVACCIRRDRLDALRRPAPGAPAGEVVEDWLRRECGGVERALHGATRTGPWLSAGPIDPGIRLRAGDELFRIGNAAGEAHPILGEGVSMALQSAALLCGRLVAQARGPSAGETAWQRDAARGYRKDWLRQFAPRLRLAAMFAHVAMRPVPSRVMMSVLRAWPGLLTQGARWGGKVREVAMPG